MGGYAEACKRGMLDQAGFLVAVAYFGANDTNPAHASTFSVNQRLLQAASAMYRSDGSPIPIYVNTKFTYHHGPYVPPFAGWVERDTTQRLVASWRAHPRVSRILYWFY